MAVSEQIASICEGVLKSRERMRGDYASIPEGSKFSARLGMRPVNSIAHNCAGTIANCGMVAVAEQLRELEQMGRQNDCWAPEL